MPTRILHKPKQIQKAASQKKLNGLHHSLPAEANGGGNIVGAAHTAGQKGLNDLDAVAIFQVRGAGGGANIVVFLHRGSHSLQALGPAFEIRLLCYTVS